jgi:hypothetical protein
MAVGALVSGYSASVPEIDEYGDALGASIGRSVSVYGLLGAIRLGEHVQSGVQVKALVDAIAGDRANVMGADIGIAARLSGIRGGVVIRNVGPEMRSGLGGTTEGEMLPLELRVGGSYDLVPAEVSFGAEYISARNRDGRMGLGAEYRPVAYLGLRTGVSGLNRFQMQASIGLSVTYARMGIDYAFSTHPLGSMHRVSLAYGFGKKATEFAAPGAVEKGAASVVTGAKRRVAILAFEAKGVSPEDASVTADWLRDELAKRGACSVVRSSDMVKALSGKTASCHEMDCAVEIGKRLGVDRMIIGSFGKFLSGYMLDVGVIDVSSGTVLYRVKRNAAEKDIETMIRALASGVAANLR